MRSPLLHSCIRILILAFAFIALYFLLLSVGLPLAFAEEEGIPNEVYVIVTPYTCDPDSPSWYPMTNTPGMCEVTRWGRAVDTLGMACPESWKLTEWVVPGYGRLVCDDTLHPDYEYWKGYPHIDIRVQTWAEAEEFAEGWQVTYFTIHRWQGGSLYPVAFSRPALALPQ